MNYIHEMKEKFDGIVKKLDVESCYKTFNDSPMHDGSPHVEKAGNTWHFVVTERRSEIERIASTDPDYILYLLISGVTHRMATAYEMRNRVSNIDGRRIWFEYDLKLLDAINPKWAKLKEVEYKNILIKHPYSDLLKTAQQGDAPEPASPAR